MFLTRSGSQQPYDDVAGEENVAFAIARIFDAATGTLTLREGPTRDRVARTVAAVQAVQQRQGLLTVRFTTVFEYVAVCVARDGRCDGGVITNHTHVSVSQGNCMHACTTGETNNVLPGSGCFRFLYTMEFNGRCVFVCVSIH